MVKLRELDFYLPILSSSDLSLPHPYSAQLEYHVCDIVRIPFFFLIPMPNITNSKKSP